MIEQYVYIASTSYSGSTLLSYLFNSHSKIVSIGEVSGLLKGTDPKTYSCSCGTIYTACKFWLEVEEELKRSIATDFELGNLVSKFIPNSPSLVDRFQFSNLRCNFLEKIRNWFYDHSKFHREYIKTISLNSISLSEAVCNITDKKIFIDSSKNPAAITHLPKYLKCDFKLIFLVRDGRGVLNSFIKKKRNIPEKKVIQNWVKTNNQIERLSKEFSKKNVFLLNYDHFCKCPTEIMKNLCIFLGVDFEEDIFKYYEKDHHIIGNPMRLNLKKEIIYDDSWKKSLNACQLDLFNKVAGKENTKWFIY